MNLPRIAITVGDPAGVGPEVVAAALADGRLPALGRIAVFAEPTLFDEACRSAGARALPRGAPRSTSAVLVPVEGGPPPADFAVGHPSAWTGRISANCIEAATRAALHGEVDAIVTAPIAKSALAEAGVPFPGHTEMLARLADVSSVAMLFVAGDLRVTLATIHVPLAEVPTRLTQDGLLEVLHLTGEFLREHEGIERPRLAVLGLNPHAGEGELFGDEESTVIKPAIKAARAAGAIVSGPFPGDAFFLRRWRAFDAVVAMYHDQGLIPVKLLSEGRAVNVTLGLPFVRTSVDHGTAFDIAGQGLASTESFVEAVKLASRWTSGG